MKTVSDIRRIFLDYFARQGHRIMPAAPLVPQNDPTLMFVNSGMVPFKDFFTGKDTPPSKRVASAQKSVRAGGKHNDLENVGYTARHHTFFEMMGNFSFGDYFKEDAILFAWELVTKEYGIAPEKLSVTVYHTDDEAFNLWKKIAGLPEERIIRIATSDNFWSMGDTGPCGPCSEIFYDNGPSVPGGPPGSPDEDGDRFKEIWNLVFMQYEQVDKETRIALPKPSIDTGMGLERVASVLQGKLDNYDIDLFQAIIHDICERTSTKPVGDDRISQRVIADHLRACAFLIADGVLPSNEGRGYVLRRIMRRAMRHAHLLGAKEPLMHQLVPVLNAQMSAAYPELTRADALIKDTLYREENRFRDTLARGLKLLDEEMGRLPVQGTLPGEIAFKLYDTFGFPLDLTNDVLRRKDYVVDQAGFDAAMQKQQEMARKSWTGSGDKTTDKIWFDIQNDIGPSEFLGYATLKSQAIVKALVKDGKDVKEVKQGDEVEIVLSQTPFYAESGGQVGDVGMLEGEGFAVSVADTQKPIGSFHVHKGKVEKGTLRLGDAVEARVDVEQRQKLQAHHSAAHLLHEALKRELGDHVAQKGSRVEPGRLRLDFSQPDPITEVQLRQIVSDIRAQITANTPVNTNVMTLDEARETGARALFGEKYGDEVRVVSMGAADDTGRVFSIELCGGTHVKNTAEIGAFRILAESGISAGVRRIQAVVGAEAEALAEKEKETLQHIGNLFKAAPHEIVERIEKLMAENQALRSEVGVLRKKAALGDADGAGAEVETIDGRKFMARVFDDLPVRELKPVADQFKQQMGSGIVVLVTRAEERASLVVAVTQDLNDKISAVDLVKIGVVALGGTGGGGRPDLAQAGGPNAAAAEIAISHIRDHLAALG